MSNLDGGPHCVKRDVLGHVAAHLSDTTKTTDLSTDGQELADEAKFQLNRPSDGRASLDVFCVESMLRREEVRREHKKVFDFFWQRTTVEGDEDFFDKGKSQHVCHVDMQNVSRHHQRCTLHSAQGVLCDTPVRFATLGAQKARYWLFKVLTNETNDPTTFPQSTVNVEDDAALADILVLGLEAYQRRSGSLPKRRNIERTKLSGTMTVCLGMMNGVS